MLRFLDLLRPASNGPGATIAEADRKRDDRRWAEAATLYRAALSKEPGLAPIWVQLGHALKEAGDLGGAEGAYKRSLELLDAADTHLQLGHLYKLMNRHKDSEQGYLMALEREPDLKDARDELRRMGWNRTRLSARFKSRDQNAELHSTLAHISFELSDLVDFLQRARYPTGIQRVQLELAAALTTRYRESDVQFVYYDHGRYVFVEVDRDQISDIIELVQNADRSENRRVDIANQLKSDLLVAPEFAFPRNSTLVNVGTSWGYWNYMMSVRHNKKRHDIRFAPLIHDCIPLLYPEYCDEHLIGDFLNWLVGMLPQADMLLANSENTLRDAKAFASQLEIAAPPRSAVLRLNGEFLSNATSVSAEAKADARDLMRSRNLDSEEYVLFVSTIEPRKNHAIALNAWSRMLKRKDGRKVPKLVCVGNPGWMNGPFHQRLARDKALNERVVLLHNVSDQALRLLYEKCAFTIFPSLYEGWGLPISEALSYGKVPLVSRVSSHPEAGGELAEYFDLGSEADFQAQLEKLIYDQAFRKQREETILAGRPLRPWSDIGAELVAAVEQLAASASDGPTSMTAPPIECGRLYSFARTSASRIADLVLSGDVYRDGNDWHVPEPWGCWARGRAGDLTFSLPAEMGSKFLIFLQIVGLNSLDNTAVVSVPGTGWSAALPIGARTTKWAKIPIVFSADNKARTVVVRISADRLHNFSQDTEGDVRESGFGLKAIYVCQTDNTPQRQAIAEAIALGSTDEISARFSSVAKL